MPQIRSFDQFISRQNKWKSSLLLMRKILLEAGLEETIKWGFPVYTSNGKNIVGIGSFNSYAGLWFFQGALLKDEKKKLINAQDGKTKALRQWRFESAQEIDKQKESIRSYVEEAILNQKQGKQIKPVREKKRIESPELNQLIKSNIKIKNGFNKLTTAKQREYAEYISEAKRSETKQKRLEKIAPMIIAGQGINDKYIKK
jgi:uncharacterized protein YdeI (YjbR/CyaY-like superfamily)